VTSFVTVTCSSPGAAYTCMVDGFVQGVSITLTRLQYFSKSKCQNGAR